MSTLKYIGIKVFVVVFPICFTLCDASESKSSHRFADSQLFVGALCQKKCLPGISSEFFCGCFDLKTPSQVHVRRIMLIPIVYRSFKGNKDFRSYVR